MDKSDMLSSNSQSAKMSGSRRQKPSMCSSELGSRVEAIRIQLEEERKRRMDVEQQIQDFVYQRGGPQAAAVAKILKESDLVEQQHSAKRGGPSSHSKGSVRSMRSDASSNRSQQSSSTTTSSQQYNSNQQYSSASSYGRQPLPPIPNENQSQQQQSSSSTSANVPHPPQRKTSVQLPPPVEGDIIAKCETEASQCDKLLRQLNHSHAAVLSRKPPLPQAARGISRKSGPNGQSVAQTGAAGCDYVMARRSKATPAQLYMMNQWHQERMDKINAFTFGVAGGNGGGGY